MCLAGGGFYNLVMKVDRTLLSVSADLFVNLAAGWIGVIIIAPNFSEKKGITKAIILIFDSIAAILCVVIAVLFRKYE